MKSALEHLKTLSVVVADTADLEAIQRLSPVDATTNPSLVLQQAKTPRLSGLIERVRVDVKQGTRSPANAATHLACQMGAEIAGVIPGYVSTEVDARLSFDTQAQIDAGRQIIQEYQQLGVDASRILVKLAATWEGIQACKQLELEGIGCNLTLVFCETQALAAAAAQATLISPFVGRIYDWYVARGQIPSSAQEDPGVISVQNIHRTFKAHGVRTIVMGASFRSAEQVLALAGCDRLTISPALLDELASRNESVAPLPIPKASEEPLRSIGQSEFLLSLATDPMTNEKLADGITRFIADQEALEALLR